MKNRKHLNNAPPAKHKPSGSKPGPVEQGKAKPGNSGQNKVNPMFILLILAYAFIPVFVPNFNTLDSNGPKFLALALLNLVSLVVLLTDAGYRRRPEMQTGFFGNWIGAVYALFVIISLLSFFNAINLVESVLNFVKIMTVFAAAYVMYVIFSSNRKYIEYLAVALTFLLIADCLTVFYQMALYISREIKSIMDIESIYSHKNILTSAIFLKIPFALYLVYFYTGWKKVLGYAAGIGAVFAILMLSTRAFYLGLGILLISLTIFLIIRQLVQHKKGVFIKVVVIFGIFILAVAAYTLTQRYFFPKNTDTIWNTGVISRLSSIKTDESSANARLSSWKESFQLIKRHPVLGVGTGNWKVTVLELENQRLTGFNYSYKNHNDFIEITAETGLTGGLTFLSMFILILLHFTKESFNSGPRDDRLRLLFLSGFGILAYSVDAFFNFPHDRPEIQVLFAFFAASGAVALNGRSFTASPKSQSDHHANSAMPHYIIIAFAGLFMLGSIWILTLNARSLYYQRKAYEDLRSNQYARPASYFLENFPFIPTVTSHGEPVSVVKAMYLINEKRYQEAIDLLKADHSSPYDSGPEYYIAMGFERLGMKDSAFIWSQKAYQLKPLHAKMAMSLSSGLFEKDQKSEAFKVLDDLLSADKRNRQAWLLFANQLFLDKQYEKAVNILDSAKKYLPGDTAITRQYNSFSRLAMITPQKELYDIILVNIKKGEFSKAIELLNIFIGKESRFSEAYANRAICYNVLGNYPASVKDINKSIQLGLLNYELVNLRGENLVKMGSPEKACGDFKAAMDHGVQKAAENMKKYCLAKSKRSSL